MLCTSECITEEPGAVVPHAGICMGAVRVTGRPIMTELSMLRHFLFLFFLCTSALSDPCSGFKDSGNGVPAIFLQEKCYAKLAFQDGKFALAAKHFEKASSMKILDAPNYSLRLEWGESLCLNGNIARGRELIESFILMARADLGEFSCPTETDALIEAIQEEHMEMICVGYGSSLTNVGKQEVARKLELAKEKLESCSGS